VNACVVEGRSGLNFIAELLCGSAAGGGPLMWRRMRSTTRNSPLTALPVLTAR